MQDKVKGESGGCPVQFADGVSPGGHARQFGVAA
jgi:hypothetical protein